MGTAEKQPQPASNGANQLACQPHSKPVMGLASQSVNQQVGKPAARLPCSQPPQHSIFFQILLLPALQLVKCRSEHYCDCIYTQPAAEHLVPPRSDSNHLTRALSLKMEAGSLSGFRKPPIYIYFFPSYIFTQTTSSYIFEIDMFFFKAP